MNEIISPLYALVDSSGAAAAAAAPSVDNTSQYARSRHFKMALNKAVLKFILHEDGERPVCAQFENTESCQLGDRCQHAHLQLCMKFYKKNHCNLGAACPHSHSPSRVQIKKGHKAEANRRCRENAKEKKRAQREAAGVEEVS
jgi:hypothetical protein